VGNIDVVSLVAKTGKLILDPGREIVRESAPTGIGIPRSANAR